MLALAAAACGSTSSTPASSSSSSSSSSSAPSGLAACTGTVTVATELPVSGNDASDGVPTQNGATLAVDQANANKTLGGCTLTLINKDDTSAQTGAHDPTQGASNMTALAGNQSVVGVVGAFNSSVCEAEEPISNAADLVQISPSCTNPGLTIPGSNSSIDTNSLRPSGKITFFRVCTTDIGQGAGLAQVAKSTLNATKAYVFDDQETYGAGLAATFITDFTKLGGTVVGHSSLPSTTTDFTSELTQAKSDGADLIFFGGTSSTGGGIIRKQMASVGLGSLPFLGGDGIQDTQFFTEAGSAGDGAYSTIAAPNTADLPTAATFVSDYTAKFNSAPGAYSANAFDAMNIIITAIKQAITANGGKIPTSPAAFRESVRANVAAINYSGAIGTTSFDSNGDTTNKLLTLWVGKNGQWTYSSTLTVQG
ncbi:MAG TPA: branched-chain amino acid ABC transporter substrate-binding protein [Candidatus Binatia bacterium]|nr:branched-chain amino acid ABC transporter substrate-binding protein [Candidatus Binatia bacterium]